VAKIVGPGNAWVAAPSAACSAGRDRHDRGPSEVLVIADKTANPD